MRKLFYLFLSVLLFSGCVSQKLTIKNDVLPEKLGINIENNAGISDEDWQYFELATDSFIQYYNNTNSAIKLYKTHKDNNAIMLNFMRNEYVTKDKQILGVFVTLAGIATPFVLIAAQAPFWIAFWYLPKNVTIINKSLTVDLNPENKIITTQIRTGHGFKNLNAQKIRQRDAYFNYLKNLIAEIDKSQKTIDKQAPDYYF